MKQRNNSTITIVPPLIMVNETTMENNETKTIKWFNLREFMNYLHEKNPRLYEEALDFVSSAVAEEQGKFLDPEEGDWTDSGSSMGVNMTDIDPDITEDN